MEVIESQSGDQNGAQSGIQSEARLIKDQNQSQQEYLAVKGIKLVEYDIDMKIMKYTLEGGSEYLINKKSLFSIPKEFKF